MKISKWLHTSMLCAAAGVLSSSALAGKTPGNAAVPEFVEGELTVIFKDDFSNRRFEREYQVVNPASGKRWRVEFEGPLPPNIASGMRVKGQGKRRGQTVYLAADGLQGGVEAMAAVQTVAGDQRTIVMLADFSDAPLSCSARDVAETMFSSPQQDSVHDLYQETTLGNVSFSGDVVGPFDIGFSSAGACDVNGWAQAAENAAKDAGVDLGLYQRRVYVLPENNTCGWAGLGSVGGSPSYAWVMRCGLGDTYAHELGHNLGMNHAATLSNEYGDTTDFMGAVTGKLRQVNGPHAAQMGWRAPEKLVEISTSGTFDIAPLEYSAAQSVAPQVLRVLKPDTGEYYHLSYRQQVGFDQSLPYQLTQTLQVHKQNTSGGITTLLASVQQGSSFIDSSNGLSFTHVSRTSDYLSVAIEIADAPAPGNCQVAVPELGLSPALQAATAGTSLQYSLTLTNRDSANCESSSFVLADLAPAGWQSSVSLDQIVLAPGQSGAATLSVLAPAGAAPADYPVGLAVSSAGVAAHSAQASATYSVVEACQFAAPQLGVDPASQTGLAGDTKSYTLSLHNADGAACAAATFALALDGLPAGWSAAIQPGYLWLPPGGSGEATLTVTSGSGASDGAYALLVEASGPQAVHADSVQLSYRVDPVPVVEDTQAPTVPANLGASAGFKQIDLSWSASSDNVGVTRYAVLRDGLLLDYAASTAYADTAAQSGQLHSYQVFAEDAAGNQSAASAAVGATLKTKGKGGSGGDSGGTKGNGKGPAK